MLPVCTRAHTWQSSAGGRRRPTESGGRRRDWRESPAATGSGACLLARGRDAADVAIRMTFGLSTLANLAVWTGPVAAARFRLESAATRGRFHEEFHEVQSRIAQRAGGRHGMHAG